MARLGRYDQFIHDMSLHDEKKEYTLAQLQQLLFNIWLEITRAIRTKDVMRKAEIDAGMDVLKLLVSLTKSDRSAQAAKAEVTKVDQLTHLLTAFQESKRPNAQELS